MKDHSFKVSSLISIVLGWSGNSCYKIHCENMFIHSVFSLGKKKKANFFWRRSFFFVLKVLLQASTKSKVEECLFNHNVNNQESWCSQAGFIKCWGVWANHTQTECCFCFSLEIYVHLLIYTGFPGGASGKEPAYQCRRCKRRGSRVRSLGWEDLLEGDTATSILSWRIPWAE